MTDEMLTAGNAMAARLALMPCTCIEVGSWPAFKAEGKYKARECGNHKLIREWDEAKSKASKEA